MEESKTSENENHEPKKNAWALSEESKAVKVITNQTLKAKNDKSTKEIGTNSPNRNSSKKNKQNDLYLINGLLFYKFYIKNLQLFTSGSTVLLWEPSLVSGAKGHSHFGSSKIPV